MPQSEDQKRVPVDSFSWSLALGRRLAWLRAHVAAWQGKSRLFLRRYLPNEAQHLFALTLGVGGLCGLVAVAFHLAIRAAEHALIERALHADQQSWIAWTLLTPTCGGLLAGALLTYVVPGARGSGIPQVKQAFALETGRIRARDAIGKFFVSAMQIGSGASLGREGPTVHICAGVTSLLARLTALPPRNMRRLTPVGVAAGIAAAFNAPVAAVTFTIEEIVGTLDHAVLSGVVVAAALAAVIERGILGIHPVIEVKEAYGLDHVSSLPLFALLGLAAAGTSVVFTDGLLNVRLWFRARQRLPQWMHPAVGGLATGALAVAVLKWLGTGGVNPGAPAPSGFTPMVDTALQVTRARFTVCVCAAMFVLGTAPSAQALDKQGSAHGGQVGGDSRELNVSGAAMLGASLYNPSYAARPDNTGLALFRYALHVDVDLLGRLLSIPIDINALTDRERKRALKLAPSELDLIGGVTSTNGVAKGFDLEMGARVEHDRPVDRGSYSQTYVDVRARLLYSIAALSPGLGNALHDGDNSGFVTLGWFAVNPSYAARPDNTGRALFRYTLHDDVSFCHRRFGIGFDTTFFSDRRQSNPIAPSELDVTGLIIARAEPVEFQLAYERDMPIDRGGLVQSLLYAVVSYGFDFHDALHPASPSAH
jgi:H+/Cl- antiporter ClcA